LDNKVFDIIDARCNHEDSDRIFKMALDLHSVGKNVLFNSTGLF